MENNFGNRLKSVRKALNLTQGKFAEPLGIKKSAISNAENGIMNLSGSVLKLIELHYSINGEWLETGEGQKFVEKKSQVSQKETDYDLHGGWKPALKSEDWGVLGKAHEVISSNTVYSATLISNINAFHDALMAEKGKIELMERIKRLEKIIDDLKQQSEDDRRIV